MKKLLPLLLVLFLLSACAKEPEEPDLPIAPPLSEDAEVITGACRITAGGAPLPAEALDGDDATFAFVGSGVITVKSDRPIGGVYLKFDETPPEWTLRSGEVSFSCGKYGFFHEYQPAPVGSLELTLEFAGAVSVTDVCILSTGKNLPDFVQVWRPAEGLADVMLLSCHADDEHIFFAGAIPDALARGAEVQVCYFTDHVDNHVRRHELLNGLWATGLRRYPVIGYLPDLPMKNEAKGLKKWGELGFTFDGMVESQVELYRKYKPQIVLIHDIDGEYGHGAHMLDSHSARDALGVSADPAVYPASAEKYGVWNVPKAYVHLFGQNAIDFEIDVPLEYYGGLTAYQVSQNAFRFHVSQQGTRYTEWLLGTAEAPITDSRDFPEYGPRYYGLYRTTVGPDEIKTDFYEHITFYEK